MVDQVNMLLRMIAKTIVSFGTMVVKTESLIFQNFNYIDPIFNCLQRIERLVSLVLILTLALQLVYALRASAKDITQVTTRVPLGGTLLSSMLEGDLQPRIL